MRFFIDTKDEPADKVVSLMATFFTFVHIISERVKLPQYCELSWEAIVPRPCPNMGEKEWPKPSCLDVKVSTVWNAFKLGGGDESVLVQLAKVDQLSIFDGKVGLQWNSPSPAMEPGKDVEMVAEIVRRLTTNGRDHKYLQMPVLGEK